MSRRVGIGRYRALGLSAGVLFLAASSALAAQQAIQASREIAEESLLDVAIEIFDPGAEYLPGGVPPKQNGQVVLPDLRKAEARFIPIRLMETLQATGFWGAVRVVPEAAGSADLAVAGEIVKSNGRELVLEVTVADASGRTWLDRKYKQEADYAAYSGQQVEQRDPYHALYGSIANDMLAELRKRDVEELDELRQIASLRFAADIAPGTFGDYFEVRRKGRLRIVRLPAEDDPMLARVMRIRERDYMFVDTLNAQYAAFGDSMEEPYDSWRAYSFEEQVALEELRRKARRRKILGALAVLGGLIAQVDNGYEAAARDLAILGGMAAIQSGVAKGKEAKIHAEALRELASSFEAEVKPMVVEIEGKTVELKGSREEQFTAWRGLLREMWATETGLPLDPDVEPGLIAEGSEMP